MSITDNYIGIPFVDGGRDKDGCDCWGLIKILYKDLLETELPDYHISCYETEQVIDTMEKESAGSSWVAVDKPEFGDVVLMSLDNNYRGHINHVGFYIGRGRFIHTMRKTGSIIQRNNDLGCPKFMGIVRWNKEDPEEGLAEVIYG